MAKQNNYVATERSPISDEDARILGSRFAELMESGPITREDVVDDARLPSSPTHDFFEWDDSVAGEKYRLQQAGNFLRFVKVELPDVEEPTRAFHPVTIVTGEDRAERGYFHIRKIAQRDDWLDQVIEREVRVLQGCQRRLKQYRGLRQHLGIVVEGALQEAIEQLVEA